MIYYFLLAASFAQLRNKTKDTCYSYRISRKKSENWSCWKHKKTHILHIRVSIEASVVIGNLYACPMRNDISSCKHVRVSELRRKHILLWRMMISLRKHMFDTYAFPGLSVPSRKKHIRDPEVIYYVVWKHNRVPGEFQVVQGKHTRVSQVLFLFCSQIHFLSCLYSEVHASFYWKGFPAVSMQDHPVATLSGIQACRKLLETSTKENIYSSACSPSTKNAVRPAPWPKMLP